MTVDYEVEYDNRGRVPEHPEIFARWISRGRGLSRGGARRRTRPALRPRRAADHRPVPGQERRTATRRWRCSSTAAGGARSSRRCSASWRPGRTRTASASRSPATISARTSRSPTIIEQMRSACLWLWRKYKKRIFVYGHSAGGHLAACMLAQDWKAFASDAPADLVPAAYAISGVFDLAPLRARVAERRLAARRRRKRAACRRCTGKCRPAARSTPWSARWNRASSCGRAGSSSTAGARAAWRRVTRRSPAPIISPWSIRSAIPTAP